MKLNRKTERDIRAFMSLTPEKQRLFIDHCQREIEIIGRIRRLLILLALVGALVYFVFRNLL